MPPSNQRFLNKYISLEDSLTSPQNTSPYGLDDLQKMIGVVNDIRSKLYHSRLMFKKFSEIQIHQDPVLKELDLRL